MSAEENQPNNINFLGQNGFRFTIKRLPTVNYFCQSATLPSVSVGVVESPTPFAFVPRPGDRITYDPLVLTFKVDENLQNYFEIQRWIEGLGHPDDLKQTADLSREIRSQQIGGQGSRALGYYTTFVSDGVLSILTSNKNVNKNIFFYDLFPISLSELQFESTNVSIEYLQATVTFRYRKYQLDV
jgi:hypothetical protein